MDIKYVSLGKAATRRQYSYSGPVNTPRKLFLLNSAHTLAQKVFLFISTVVCILSISQQSIKIICSKKHRNHVKRVSCCSQAHAVQSADTRYKDNRIHTLLKDNAGHTVSARICENSTICLHCEFQTVWV